MGKKKDKKRQFRVRQQRKAAKHNLKKAVIRSRLPGYKTIPDPPGLKSFVADNQIFWLAHGINCLASDYDEGLWQPVFPSIYEGEEPGAQELARQVLFQFSQDLESEGWNVGKMIVAWSVQEPITLFTYYQTALQKVKELDASADAEQVVRLPHNGTVWRIFEDLKEEVRRNQSGT